MWPRGVGASEGRPQRERDVQVLGRVYDSRTGPSTAARRAGDYPDDSAARSVTLRDLCGGNAAVAWVRQILFAAGRFAHSWKP